MGRWMHWKEIYTKEWMRVLFLPDFLGSSKYRLVLVSEYEPDIVE